MLARLGNVIYWVATIIAIAVLVLLGYGALLGGGQANPFAQGVFAIGAIIVWLFGWACRYILAASGTRYDQSN